MPLAKDFIGIGMPAAFAQMEGFNPAVAVTAAGTTTVNATVLLLAQDFVLMTATGADGVRLPAGTLQLQQYIVTNVSAGTGKIYPPSGGNFAGDTTDNFISLLSRKTVIFWRHSALGWSYNMSA